MLKSLSIKAGFASPHVFSGVSMLLLAIPLSQTSPYAALWTTPCILIASVLITWGAESAQFFVAQGFALAILAWMQTLPEFAVEAVLAWRQQTALLLANLTGALRLLTGLAWPMIYLTAAVVHRRRVHEPLRKIELDRHQSVEVIALIPPLAYAVFIWWKGNLHLYDGCVLLFFYVAYLAVLSKLPPQEKEGLDDLGVVPRNIVRASKVRRILGISLCFAIGGGLIYFTAEPFLGSIVAVASAVGIPTFIVIQWFAPVISEFPELASSFYFARQEGKASIAVMNIASSNINQWTLLVAMLPVVFSLSRGTATGFAFDAEQQWELILTVAQSFAALVLLLNMELAWWEALTMFVLFALQFVLPRFFGSQAHSWITAAFVVWSAVEMIRMLAKLGVPPALSAFVETWRAHVAR